MDWINLIYLLVGGILTFLGGLISNIYQNIKEDKRHNREKREETYLEVFKLLVDRDSARNYQGEIVTNFIAKLELYSSVKIKKLFADTFMEKNNDIYKVKAKQLRTEIKKEIGLDFDCDTKEKTKKSKGENKVAKDDNKSDNKKTAKEKKVKK